MNKYQVNVDFRIVLYTIATILGLYFAYQLRGILILILFAFIINAGVRPLVTDLQRRGVKRWLAILLVYLGVLLFLILFAFVLFSEALNQVRLFVELFNKNSNNIADIINNNLPFLKNFVDIDKVLVQIRDSITGGVDINALTSSQAFALAVQAFNLVSVSGISVVEGVVGGLFSMIITLVISVYMVAKEENFHDSLLNLFPNRYTEKLSDVFMKIQSSLGSWLVGQILLMAIIGFLTYLVVIFPRFFDPTYELYKYALILGIIAGFLEALPNIGPVLTLIIGVIIALVSGAGLPVIIYIAFAMFMTQELEAWIFVPVIMKRAIDIHPILSILGILIGFELGGPITALLSIPVIGALQIVILELSARWKRDYNNELKEQKAEVNSSKKDEKKKIKSKNS